MSFVHRSSFCVHHLTAWVFLVLLAGCGSYEPAAPPAAAPAAPADSAVAPPAAEGGAAPQPGSTAATAGSPAPATNATSTDAATTVAPSSPAAGAESYPIALSTGVALAQTGPNGILMSFSTDYSFEAGEPDPKCQYVWVIKRTRGAPLNLTVKLAAEGNLTTLVDRWRPEEGPFEGHIEQRCGTDARAVSRAIALDRVGE